VVKTGRGGGNKQTGKTKKYEPNTHTVANFLERHPGQVAYHLARLQPRRQYLV